MARSVLIVDDDYSIVESLSEILADEGYEVSVARNGREALARLAIPPLPGIVLLDLMMPVMDGYEFRRRQLEDPALAQIATLVLTAGAVDDRVRELRVSGWLRKPIALQVLLSAMRTHCAGAGRAAHPRDHIVRFYEDDARLAEHVSGYLGEGLERGEGALLIATPAHRDAFRERLRARGLDVSALEASGRLAARDAQDTLATLCSRGVLEPQRFQTVVGPLLLAAKATGAPLRIYGEIVNLLWRDGNIAAAVRLEELWNGIARTERFSLMCAYLVRGGDREAPVLEEICRQHSAVLD